MDNYLTKENNNFNLVRLFVCLQVLILHTYNFYDVGENTFKNVDISYGTYIYHVLVINTFLQLGISSDHFIWIYIIAILCGLISWFTVEKRFLKKKQNFSKIPIRA